MLERAIGVARVLPENKGSHQQSALTAIEILIKGAGIVDPPDLDQDLSYPTVESDTEDPKLSHRIFDFYPNRVAQVVFNEDKGEIELTYTEALLLLCLMKRPRGIVVTYKEIAKEVWGESDVYGSKYPKGQLKKYIQRLRRKLEPGKTDKEGYEIILSAVGRGYYLPIQANRDKTASWHP